MGMSTSYKKNISVLKKRKKYIHKNMSWHCARKKKKEVEKNKSEIKHMGLVENRSRPRMEGMLLVLGALY